MYNTYPNARFNTFILNHTDTLLKNTASGSFLRQPVDAQHQYHADHGFEKPNRCSKAILPVDQSNPVYVSIQNIPCFIHLWGIQVVHLVKTGI